MIASFAKTMSFDKNKETHFAEKIIAYYLQNKESMSHFELNPDFDYKIPNDWEFLKRHTIRSGHRWKPKHKIHLAQNNRTPDYICFAKSYFNQTENIEISFLGSITPCVAIEGIYLLPDQIEILANNDGLSFDDFCRWFYKPLKDKGATFFSGQILHWTKGSKMLYTNQFNLNEKNK